MSGERGPALVVRRPGEVVLEERDVPRPGPGEVLIRPEVVGLCGTDLEIVDGSIDPAYTRYPLVLGHEWSGTVAADWHPPVGEGPAPGSLVVAEGIVPCGHCPYCRAGQTNLCLTYDELGFTRDGKAILGLRESDVCFSAAKLFFAYGLGNALTFPLAVGATAVLMAERPTPAAISRVLRDERPTIFYGVPTLFAALLANPDLPQRAELALRRCVSAGEALPAEIGRRWTEHFGVEILDSLGSTETLQMVIANRPGEAKPGSSGKIIPGYEAKIVDDDGRLVAPGEIGNLLIKGESTCASYWNQHEKSKATFEGPWFRTGDKYYQDEEGCFWYAGRANDLFKVNGRWLSPAEVEGALIAHPAIREAAVVARDDESGLTKVAAFVVVNDEFTASEQLTRELQEWVTERIGAYKRPRWIEFLPELPKTATGKLQRFKLRELQGRKTEGPSEAL
jgi:benzoate-CoA ligase